jgi:hypothetical protein
MFSNDLPLDSDTCQLASMFNGDLRPMGAAYSLNMHAAWNAGRTEHRVARRAALMTVSGARSAFYREAKLLKIFTATSSPVCVHLLSFGCPLAISSSHTDVYPDIHKQSCFLFRREPTLFDDNVGKLCPRPLAAFSVS